ncbi:hypothetical protein AXE80_07150 [Wenyingzhuangia fucanilytica]|uniref:Xylose isomerase-like TIM barrel domain-containing protein n=1 Tax=Wenyingzhuangia fucanilytica TaxID=1790137 RepID=A0A1B1Y5L2_9FLAO|nr:TIM barrel protein [Wenyingzhuangia fucanilytica]ANW96066.1 hypothetical protein AXE80_07150 [Wenyingzhuangia fucanilytica]
MNRRSFIQKTSAASLLISTSPSLLYANQKLSPPEVEPFRISLSQWGYERDIFGQGRANNKWFKKMLVEDPKQVLQGTLDPTDIVIKAKNLGLHGVDLVSSMIQAHQHDKQWLWNFKAKAKDHHVKFICMMADGAYKIGDYNAENRKKAILEHQKWIDASAELGCEHVRINPFGTGTYLQMLNNCASSLTILSEYAKKQGIKISIENHGHPSSNGAWANMLIETVQPKNLGLFLDYGNFFMGGFSVRPRRYYDAKQGMEDLAPFATGISAKTKEFTVDGKEANIDYDMCMEETMKHKFKGWVSAEYAGKDLSCDQGAQKTVALLQHYQQKYKEPSIS